MPSISTNPVDIGKSDLSWSQIPSTSVLTVGSATAQGGVGILGYKYLMFVVPVTSPASSGGGGGPVPTAKALKGAVVGTAYSETISAQAGTSPYTFAVTVGTLPAGLSLNGSTGVISGTPTAAGTSDFTIQATDSTAAVGSTDFEISVSSPSGGGNYGWVS